MDKEYLLMEQKRRGRKPTSYKEKYETYLRTYATKEGKLANKNAKMYEDRYSERNFKAMYDTFMEMRKEEVASGKRKTVGAVIRDIVELQSSSVSEKQAKRLYKANKRLIEEEEKRYNFPELREAAKYDKTAAAELKEARKKFQSVKNELRVTKDDIKYNTEKGKAFTARIGNKYNELRDKGTSVDDALSEIWMEFFGSEYTKKERTSVRGRYRRR